ncbi:MAG: MBL fold metallo-hydrolase, partial [Anaerolineales bacterium]|nr:MBL fold metallo-hydrolase [Anaerolineales bacterium]
MTADFVRLTPEWWVLPCRSMRYNAGVVISGGEAVLIDPGLFPDEFDLIRRLLAEQGAQPRTLLLTHSHWDHVLGPEQFPGVPVLAHERYPALAAEFADDLRWGLAYWERQAGLQRARPFAVPLPDKTVGVAGPLPVGGLTLSLRHVPGHAADQLALYQAEAGTLWASDILSDTEIPFVSDSL